jgi:hypothetical protein
MKHRRSSAAALLLALCLTACGGTNSGAMPGGGSPGRGALLQSPPQLVSAVAAGDLLVELSAAVNLPLLALSGTPLCDIAVFHLKYGTVGANNEPTTASAALMVPGGLDARCRGSRPR